MSTIEEMIRSHPHQMKTDRDVIVSANVLASSIDTLYRCIEMCTACADSCLGETNVGELVRCIRLNLDCADVCTATAAILSRQTEPDWNLVRNQLQACITACQACGEECRRHAEHHEHCRICADTCRECEAACQRVLNGLPA